MQRNFTYKKAVNYIAIFAIFSFYNSLSTIYLLLPPLLSILFFYFLKAFRKKDIPELILIASMLLIFEINYGFIIFFTFIFFVTMYNLFYDSVNHYVNCKICLKLIYVLT
ncbi:MAG: hypothetical protein U9N42_06310, partial [Campylobacterota bacterium]|nr:hypothetical protein [Campylobacterota bacterium]